jgi:chromosome segregation ATPase
MAGNGDERSERSLDRIEARLDTIAEELAGMGKVLKLIAERTVEHEGRLMALGDAVGEVRAILGEHGRILGEHGRTLDEHGRTLELIRRRVTELSDANVQAQVDALGRRLAALEAAP